MKMCKLKVYFVFFCCKIFRYVTLLHIAVQRGKLTNKFNNLTTTCQWRISYTSINISLLTFTTLYEKHAKHFDLACLSVHKSLSYSLIYIFAADSPFLLSKETFTSTIIWNLVLKGIRTLQCEIICQWIFFAFFKTSTFTCVLQHIIFSWPLSDLEREIFWYELHPFSRIMIFFPDNFNFLR